MKKITKLSIAGIITGFCLLITGFFLRAILFPVQDIEIMSEHELLALQKAVALNYPLGTVLYYVGAALIIFFATLVVFRRIHTSANKS